jgi:FlaA1/EpsC-like NDP-sugar epimerase
VIESLGLLDWRSFLERDLLPGPTPDALAIFREARILVTGAGGSIGSALALRLASAGARDLVLLEASESHLFSLQKAMASASPAFFLGSTGDLSLLNELFAKHTPTLIFHAAAFKHVPLLEEQPCAAVANNITATRTLLHCAARHGARLVLLSTDKAVEPASVMGATKRVAEQMVLAAGGTAVRLGNVLASRDSVAWQFAEALRCGEALSVTDPRARRYFLTMDEAVNLLLSAALAGPGLFAAALTTPHYVTDLARFLARKLAPDREAPIEFTHLRQGEKEVEQLWARYEKAGPAAEGLHAIESPICADLDSQLDSAARAVRARDPAAVLAILEQLVPGYTPSSLLRASQ